MKQHTITQSFGFAFSGIKHAIKDNRNVRIHLVIGILVFLMAAILKVKSDEFIDLIVMIVLVIAAEMINTSLEEMTDLITTEHRQEAKVAKDVAAGMVLVVSIGAAIVGIYIFIPYLLKLI
jgi:diacylglycerol kinase